MRGDGLSFSSGHVFKSSRRHSGFQAEAVFQFARDLLSSARSPPPSTGAAQRRCKCGVE